MDQNKDKSLTKQFQKEVEDKKKQKQEAREYAEYVKQITPARTWCSVLLILLSVILTGFSRYQKIADFGGAGALVPITGFANGVCATAVEYQAEGQVFGVGVKIFTIAGPVILYGIFSSWLFGLLYWLCRLF